MKKELTRLHSNAAALCSSRWRKQCVHLLLLKMFGENLRQSAVREPIVEAVLKAFSWTLLCVALFLFNLNCTKLRTPYHSCYFKNCIWISFVDTNTFSILIFTFCAENHLTTTWRTVTNYKYDSHRFPTSTSNLEDYIHWCLLCTKSKHWIFQLLTLYGNARTHWIIVFDIGME